MWYSFSVFPSSQQCTQVDVRSNNLDENICQIFIPVIEKPHFESFSGIPVKKIRDNAITEINVKGVEGSELEACGGVILAHCLKSNSSVTVVEASCCGMGTAGAKAFGDVLRVNKTLQHLNVSNNSFGKVQVGDQVKLKSSGEMKTVTGKDGDYIEVEGSDWVDPSEFEWESQVPAFCAGLAASPSLLSVSDSMWCSGRLLRPFRAVGE